MTYIKQLDTLRAIAVLCVILHHWVPSVQTWGLGVMGVTVFFVLSGYLITRILLTNKIRIDNNTLTRSAAIKNFIIRRALRIFPIYYLILLILFIVHSSSSSAFTSDIYYYLFYGFNLLVYKTGHWHGYLSHFWTLAVEEQFYMIWPWFIMYTPQRYIRLLIALFISIGILAHPVLEFFLGKSEFTGVLTPTSFFTFGCGALLAYVSVFSVENLIRFNRAVIIIGILSLGAYIVKNLFYNFQIQSSILLTFPSLAIIFFAMNSQAGIIHRYLLNNAILIWIGKLSYGLYLYHNFMPSLWKYVGGYSFSFGSASGYVWYIGQLFILFILAYLSWKLLEEPVLKFKKFFQ